MSTKKRTLLAQDWSVWGDISLKTATTLFQVWGLPAVSLPVKLLAAHPGWAAQTPQQDVTAWLQRVLDYWQQQAWSRIYLGYLGSPAVVEVWQRYLATAACPVILDPAMADQGQLYQGLDVNYVHAISGLLPYVDVLTPNISEAQFLVGFPIIDHDSLSRALHLLAAQMRGSQVIITSIQQDQQIGCAFLNQGVVQTSLYPQQRRTLFGSGDLFTTLVVLFLAADFSFAAAVQQATRLTTLAVKQTPFSARDIQVAAIIPALLELKDGNHA